MSVTIFSTVRATTSGSASRRRSNLTGMMMMIAIKISILIIMIIDDDDYYFWVLQKNAGRNGTAVLRTCHHHNICLRGHPHPSFHHQCQISLRLIGSSMLATEPMVIASPRLKPDPTVALTSLPVLLRSLSAPGHLGLRRSGCLALLGNSFFRNLSVSVANYSTLRPRAGGWVELQFPLAWNGCKCTGGDHAKRITPEIFQQPLLRQDPP